MKVIIINGSPRVKGSTATILHQIGNELIATGVETEYFDLKALQINSCSGCLIFRRKYMRKRCRQSAFFRFVYG